MKIVQQINEPAWLIERLNETAFLRVHPRNSLTALLKDEGALCLSVGQKLGDVS